MTMKAGTGTVAVAADARSDAGAGATPKTPSSPLVFRKPGAPAGAHPPQPWWHSALHDPYERVNVWSHGVPGAALLILGLVAACGGSDGGAPLALFCMCAACTHALSAITHVWPDSHSLSMCAGSLCWSTPAGLFKTAAAVNNGHLHWLRELHKEKLDHLGIVVLIIGTPITALMAKEHGSIPTDVLVCAIGLVAAAFLPPTLRVLGFATGIAAITFLHFQRIVDYNMGAQLVLYASGGISFLRNGGHQRMTGFSDHSILHYVVTVACGLHVWYIIQAMKLPMGMN